MGKPKSFKDLFKNKQQVPLHGGKPILQPKPQLLTPEYLAELEKRKKELTAHVNKQRCIVCGNQLDGPVNEKDAKLYCVVNNEHYKCRFIPDFNLPTSSVATYTFSQEGYEIISSHKHDLEYSNIVYKLDLNLIPKFRQREKKLILSFDGKMLKFPKNLSEQEFVQKLKVYTVFS